MNDEESGWSSGSNKWQPPELVSLTVRPDCLELNFTYRRKSEREGVKPSLSHSAWNHLGSSHPKRLHPVARWLTARLACSSRCHPTWPHVCHKHTGPPISTYGALPVQNWRLQARILGPQTSRLTSQFPSCVSRNMKHDVPHRVKAQ